MSASKLVIALGVAFVAALAWCAGPAAAAPPCAGADVYIAAHADDTLLFQSPDLLEDVQGNRCVQTVFTTAGDAGKGAKYWEGREAGAEAAYAQMAGVPNVWQASTVQLAGHAVHKETLVGQPGVTILYLRLPDGGIDGKGFPLYENQSLLKLWNGGNGQMPAIAEIKADNGSAKYTYPQLIATLTAAIHSFGAHEVRTQNYEQTLPGPDHADHVITGRLVESAVQNLPGGFAWRLSGYEGYEVVGQEPNVEGPLLAAKTAAFQAYVPHDEACGVDEDCSAPPYPLWLERQYVAATDISGLVANAGLERTVGAAAPVALNGLASSSESGGPLAYSWTQVGGPAVALGGASTATPTFVTPPHPTVLTFALTVSQGVFSSAPDFVRVRVPAASPNPTAIAGPDQSVGAGARVALDGAASWDPEGLPLAYSWAQVAGPTVALNDPGSARPSFTAPSGAASTLVFSLVVGNGAQLSAPATVRVAVAAAPSPPPPDNRPPGKPGEGGPQEPQRGKLARKQVQVTVGRPARRVVRVKGNAVPQSCRGRLPVGALCRITAAGDVVVEARRSLSRAGTFNLNVRFAPGATPGKQSLKVVIKRAKN